jgi:hypothetical protein
MKCSYHPAVESQEICSACNKFLCSECAHKIKGKAYCQDCLIEGAEWASTIKGLRLPADSPKRAAVCAIIPGLGAVYNTEYLKAIAYFTVWAALAVMGNRVSSVFGFGAFVFILFTMFDAYRSAEERVRRRLKTDYFDEPPRQDKTLVGWGVFLIILGAIFLLHNIIPFYFLNRFWPLIFILIGAFLVYRALQSRKSKSGSWYNPPPPPPLTKEDI